MNDERKYIRVYYNDMIRDYPGVWGDNDQLATWVRMLATADPMWPTPPELPRSVRPRIFAALVRSTLVDDVPDHRFRVKGLDAERERRSDAGRNAAAMRWHSEGNAEGNAEAMPKRIRAEQSKDETTRESLTGYDGRADLEAFVLARGRPPTPKQRHYLESVLAVHDITGPQWAADIILAHPDDPIGAVMEADRKWRDERLEEARAVERKAAPARRTIGLSGANAELAALMREAQLERERA